MNAADQAAAYANADFSGVNQAFVERFLETFPALRRGRILDLGCGPADVVLRLAGALPAIRIMAVDGAPAMLNEARRAVRGAALEHRIKLVCADVGVFADASSLPSEALEGFEAIISNSLLHHLHDPTILWRAIAQSAKPGAYVLVVDLFRPPTSHHVERLVDRYAAGEPEVLRTDFYNSLRAAFTEGEIRTQLDRAGLGALGVRQITDRHVAVWGRLQGVGSPGRIPQAGFHPRKPRSSRGSVQA